MTNKATVVSVTGVQMANAAARGNEYWIVLGFGNLGDSGKFSHSLAGSHSIAAVGSNIDFLVGRVKMLVVVHSKYAGFVAVAAPRADCDVHGCRPVASQDPRVLRLAAFFLVV